MRVRTTVTFLASERHCPSTSAKLIYYLVIGACVCVCDCERLPRAVLDSAVGETGTRDLSITSPMFYH